MKVRASDKSAPSLKKLRAALYNRVSTPRQGEQGVSLASQTRGGRETAERMGALVVKEFVESKTAKNSKGRPVFQQMIREAKSPDHPFDLIIAHSISRAFRNEIDFVLCMQELEKVGVKIIFQTQNFGEGSDATFIKRLLALVAERELENISFHVSHSMKENAKQGFANGGRPAFGLRLAAVEKRGDKVKKKWVPDPKTREIVKRIFELRLHGDGITGPMGNRKIRDWLNAREIKSASGGPWFSGTVERVLKNEIYIGRAFYNRTSSTDRLPRPRKDWVPIAVEPIIDEDTFHRVQALIAKANPCRTPPRIMNSDVVLGG